jgi:uncharacterized iron-regulated protein
MAILARVAVLVAALTLAACTVAPKPAAAPESDARAGALTVWDGHTGAPVPRDRLLAACAAADVILIGENHGHPVGLPWAANFLDALLSAAPDAALSLEFFERDDQSRLDDYLHGLTDEAAFRKRTERTPGNYPEGHRSMLEAAKAKGRPVIASNTPWEVIRYLRGKTYEALAQLTPEQRRLFKIPDELAIGRYRDDYDKIMSSMGGSHGAPATNPPPPPPTPEELKLRLDAGFRTQQLWDWTMADSVVRAVEAGHHPVVHVIGRFHSDFRGGTAQAIEKLRPGAKLIVISIVDEDLPGLADADKGRGDYVVYAGPAPKAR